MADEVIYSTRREFIRGTVGTLSLSATLPGFLARTAAALSEEPRDRGRVLIVLQLAGGNDGLNTVVPYGADAYYRARPDLALPAEECLKLNDEVGLHPALAPLKDLYDDGLLAIVQGVGYPNPNRSHFKSMDIWHSGDPSGRMQSGWLGRYFDHSCRGADPPRPVSAVALMREAPLALQGRRFAPLAFDDEQQLRWRSRHATREARRLFEHLNDGAADSRRPGPKDAASDSLEYLRRAALEARLGAADIHRATGRRLESDDVGRPGSLKANLALVLQMILADFPTTVYYVSIGGFDTHANQRGRHQRLLQQVAGAVKWLMDQLRQHGLRDRVLLASFSEFGRRIQQNSSRGTDHGTAAPMFLLGGSVKPGLHLKHPSFEHLDAGDLIYNCDFRRVYSALLRDWLSSDPRRILGTEHKPLRLVRR